MAIESAEMFEMEVTNIDAPYLKVINRLYVLVEMYDEEGTMRWRMRQHARW